jgi:RecB family endonuclease NucS
MKIILIDDALLTHNKDGLSIIIEIKRKNAKEQHTQQ